MKSRNQLFAISLAFICLGLLPQAQAVNPPPDGGYTGGNTAEGTNALQNLSSGIWNTALGYQSLLHDTTGNQNTATGYQALFSNTTGNTNVADGALALFSNMTGSFNTANGFYALYRNTTGGSNTAMGYAALYGNTTGNFNTAMGWRTLPNTNGSYNTACGAIALGRNAGAGNTATGYAALYLNVTGSDNTAYGASALNNNSSGSNNIAVGELAGDNIYATDNNIDIGNRGETGESDTIRIGDSQDAAYIAGISNATVAGSPVYINFKGQLGLLGSSERFKDAIEPMDNTSDMILALRPVTFRYKTRIDPASIQQFGLVAEEVEKVNPNLVVHDEEGRPYAVRYDAVNAMLLNEFLKEHRKIEEQQATIAHLKSGMEALTATVKEQAAQIQKVSAQLEASKSTPQVAENNQ